MSWLARQLLCIVGVISGSIVSSYIVEFNMPTYLSLYPSFLVFLLISRPKGLRAFHKQLAATTLMGDFTSSFRYFILAHLYYLKPP